jgi:hypothetical protein
MLKHIFKLPIGDWSNDGHGHCDYFIIESNTPVENLREIYFDTKEKTNSSLDGSDWDNKRVSTPCSEYCDDKMSAEQIEALGLNPDDYSIYQRGDFFFLDSEGFAEMFIDFIMTHNPDVKLEIKSMRELSMFPFYGYDGKNRHIGFMGYGLFDL